jgi:hypothetical protein
VVSHKVSGIARDLEFFFFFLVDFLQCGGLLGVGCFATLLPDNPVCFARRAPLEFYLLWKLESGQVLSSLLC